MFNLVQADLFKLRKSKAMMILLGITTISAVAMAVMAYLIPQGKVEASMTGIGFMFSDINIISILGGVTAALLICGDFDNKTTHNAIATGSSRGAVIISKAIVLGIALAFILLPYAIITGIALSTGSEFSMGSVAVGFLHVLTSVDGTTLSASGVLKLLAVMLTLMIVYVAQLSICVPLAFILKKPIFVVAIYYGFSILSAQLIKLSESSAVFDRIFSSTPYGGNYAFVTLNTGTGDMVKAIAVSLGFIIVMLAVTYRAFRKSEIK
ncbi:ABC transporter permease [Paenibacillus sp. GP183]|jgi:ABC-2 type transport system permease protein|uniref:ABC transporter permease n=1 Tax=Paenibacillus sp. GP183 TaxID=1882751 RepID=UPI00089BF99E|nr:ABC transporter permease [Paenibacillus sp. GP183]SED13278.1 ABC-2 type transport system permease protein [Paenibacillus sp. GP183]